MHIEFHNMQFILSVKTVYKSCKRKKNIIKSRSWSQCMFNPSNHPSFASTTPNNSITTTSTPFLEATGRRRTWKKQIVWAWIWLSATLMAGNQESSLITLTVLKYELYIIINKKIWDDLQKKKKKTPLEKVLYHYHHPSHYYWSEKPWTLQMTYQPHSFLSVLNQKAHRTPAQRRNLWTVLKSQKIREHQENT